jgi:valyl-tRNA synthetase
MPHITEELWQRLPGREAIHPETICLAPYPEFDERLPLKGEEAEVIAEVQFIVQAIRNGKKEAGLADRATVEHVWVQPRGPEHGELCSTLVSRGVGGILQRLVNAVAVSLTGEAPSPAARVRRERYDLHYRWQAAAAPQADAGKLREELEQVESTLRRVEDRLASPGFTGKAPAAVIEGARKQLAELAARRTTLQSSLTGSLSASAEE